MRNSYIALGVVFVFLFACSKEDEVPPFSGDPGEGSTSNVNFQPQEVPYSKLSDYNFFQGDLKELTPQEDVLPYELITPLFTDYAHKKRFVWMADGSSSSYNGDGEILTFDDGAVLIKNFYYDNVQPENVTKIIETRLMYKLGGEWFFANYVWNEEQTEAYFDLNGSHTSIEWMDDSNTLQSTNYRIPSETECHTCHKTVEKPIPIGPKPQNLNKNFGYEDGAMNQLVKWEDMGYLQPGFPQDIETVVDWKDTSHSLSERVRSYIDINCGHCHKEASHCDYRPMRFAYSETTDPENLGICVEPDEEVNSTISHIISGGNYQKSMVYYRMNTTDEALRMPLLGRSIVHEEAVQLMKEYISSLDPC